MYAFLDQIPLLALSVFFEPLDSFAERVQTHLINSTTSDWSFERAALNLDRPGFSEIVRGGARPLTVTMWSPRNLSDATVFRAHSEDGWLHFVRKLTQANGPANISIRSSAPESEWGVQEVEYHQPGNYWPVRALQWLQEESGYRFQETGDPLPFENLSIPPKDRIAVRTGLLEFVENLHVNIGDEDFWTTDHNAVYIRQIWKPKAIANSEMQDLIRKMGGRVVYRPKDSGTN